MCDIETSGYQATGLIAVKTDDEVHTIKQAQNATKFLETKEVQEFLDWDLQAIVGHCRFPTKGDVKFNKNNHPFKLGNTVIVHQGILTNDEEIKTQYGFTPEGETDSWVIVHLIEKFRSEGKSVLEAIARTQEELQGSWAVVLVDLLEPEKIYLFCHTKSFKVNYYPDEDIFFFSTEGYKLDKTNSEVYNYLKYFEGVRELNVAERKVNTEECMVLGGENEVEFWILPTPKPEESWWEKEQKKHKHKNNKKFGDGWKADDDKERAEYWENFLKKDEDNKSTGRLLLGENKVKIIT